MSEISDDLIQTLLEAKNIMIDIENSPFIKIFTDKARAEERQKIERERGAERQQIEKELQEEHQKIERELQEERQNVSERRREAEVEAYTNALLDIINQVFGLRGREQLEPRIREIRDCQKLASLISPVLQSDSVDELKQRLERL
jgi:hypothetical protein